MWVPTNSPFFFPKEKGWAPLAHFHCWAYSMLSFILLSFEVFLKERRWVGKEIQTEHYYSFSQGIFVFFYFFLSFFVLSNIQVTMAIFFIFVILDFISRRSPEIALLCLIDQIDQLTMSIVDFTFDFYERKLDIW